MNCPSSDNLCCSTKFADKRGSGENSLSGCKKKLRNALGRSRTTVATAWMHVIELSNGENDCVKKKNDHGEGGVNDVSFMSASVGCSSRCFQLKADWPYTVGRSARYAQFIFRDPLVSKQHCQVLFDANHRKLYLLNGTLSFSSDACKGCIVDEFRNRLLVSLHCNEKGKEATIPCSSCTYNFRGSVNGVFVNMLRVREGEVVELFAGDEVMLVCKNKHGVCGSHTRIGFIIQRIVFQEDIGVDGFDDFPLERPKLFGSLSTGKVNKRVFALSSSDSESFRLEHDDILKRAKSLITCCRQILHSDDPITCIPRCVVSQSEADGSFGCSSKENEYKGLKLRENMKFPGTGEWEPRVEVLSFRQQPPFSDCSYMKNMECFSAKTQSASIPVPRGALDSRRTMVDHSCLQAYDGLPSKNVANRNPSDLLLVSGPEESTLRLNIFGQSKSPDRCVLPPGKNFCLNRLNSMHLNSLSKHDAVSLPELLHPVDSITRIFIATFTSDIRWFLSYCNIPCHLPVTVACHNTQKCWSGSTDQRSSMPYTDFTNLVVVYPPFPEAIAFGKDRKKQGVACHHPKLLVLQRGSSMRVIVTSANLVAKQWNHVTNTVWWQDFPRRRFRDYTSLFPRIHDVDTNQDSKSDFAAQLAGFMAALVADVPSQAVWIAELAKYDFSAAKGYLVASVPGIHSYRALCTTESVHPYAASHRTYSMNFVGSVEASVVGSSHLFRTSADTNGAQLKKLAAFLGKSYEDASGMSEIKMRRNKNVHADANAVSVLVPNPEEISEEDCVQLGFLPRNVAKWVSPLWDNGFFRFSGYICPKEALAAAFAGNNVKVPLILHVSQGPRFQNITEMMEPEHVAAFCSLVASIQRCTGLWRLEEVLHQYKWPEHSESDFFYSASSIGSSINAQFLAAFSSATGKRSQPSFDSEESDPQWGTWNASDELQSPSIRIIFPTIERVKSAVSGILPSKQILCFAEKTWQRLKTAGILHDAVPHPYDRVGHPMHIKVARRCFMSKADGSSFGWVYCGSHNLSAAAWGRSISSPSSSQMNGPEKGDASRLRLHVCNYELGVIFVFPPPDTKTGEEPTSPNLDDIVLPFVVPAPKYSIMDRPATKLAMREALAELTLQGAGILVAGSGTAEETVEEISDDEEEVVEVANYVAPEEEEDEKAYAHMLWSQVDSSQSC